MNPFDDPRFDGEMLKEYGFDAERFAREQAEVKRGPEVFEQGRITGTIEPVTGLPKLHADGRPSEEQWAELGRRALARGEVACLILNGGLATRFGGGVKGVVPVLEQRSFLGLKLEDVHRATQTFGRSIPILLLSSFATRHDTERHLEENQYFGLVSDQVVDLLQTISIRLDEQGEPFFDRTGTPHYYAPGHGEFFERLHDHHHFDWLLAQGIRYLVFSNGDNLGATLEPVVLGHHVQSGADLTIEVTEKRRDANGAWDVGGSPARIDGEVRAVEGFRFPVGFCQDILPYLQANNLVFSLPALGEPLSLPRYPVKKTIDGLTCLGFEAVTCEATSVLLADGRPRLRSNLVEVPRDGLYGRFLPVKSRDDLDRIRPALRERLEAGWRRRDGRG